MDEIDSPLTPPTPSEFLESEDFELVTRKRKGKKKGKAVTLSRFKKHFSHDYTNTGQSSTEIGDGDTKTDDQSNAGDSDYGEIHNSNIPVSYNVSFADYSAEVNNGLSSSASRITLDAQMHRPPQIIYPEELPPENKEKEQELEDDAQPVLVSQPGEPDIIHILNKKALPKYAPTYQLETFEKNALLIFNQTNIEGYKKPRLGTEKDVAELERTFKGYGFEVQLEEDLTKLEIMTKLKEFSSRDFTDYGCVAVAVLTHGSKHGLIRAKDMQYSELEIVNHLQVHNKPTLVTKPKLVIIQACRGTEDIQGITVFRSQGKIMKDLDEEVEPYTLPVESDMLILHSSYIGKPSHRDELHGSWFIQSLCSKINQLASILDFESILTEVKREVAIDRTHWEHNRRTFETDINKQMPVSTSTLIRKLYLRRYGEEAPKLSSSENTAQLSNNSVLDNSMPNTPLLVQFGPCSCFLEHFSYITKCLKYFLEEYPDDATAHSFLDVANTFDDGVGFNSAKERMAKAICDHLRKMASDRPYSKYLYFYKH